MSTNEAIVRGVSDLPGDAARIGSDPATDVARLDAAVSALGDVRVSAWSEDALKDQLGELSIALCTLDSLLSRVADEVRARGLRIEEPVSA